METKLQSTCFHHILRFFLKKKTALDLVTLSHFPRNYRRKIFLLLCSINWPNFIVLLPLLCEILGNICIGIAFKPGWDVMNFEVNLIFLIKLSFLHNQNVVTKDLISWEQKKLLRQNKKTFFIIFKWLSIKQITQRFLEGESPNFQQGCFQHLSSLLLKDVVIQLRYLKSILWYYYVILLNYIIVIYETYFIYLLWIYRIFKLYSNEVGIF